MRFYSITALFFAAVSAQQPTWTNCAIGSADMTIFTFSVTPYPLCIGQNVCATATGFLNAPIIMPAKVSVYGKYLGRTVYTDNQDLCAVLASIGITCPAPITITSITLCLLVKPSCPANIPLQMTITATNGNNHILFCQSANGVIAQPCPP